VTNELNICAAHVSEVENVECFVMGAGSLAWEINCSARGLTFGYCLFLMKRKESLKSEGPHLQVRG
jgi:hypothetical protein